MAQKSKRQQEGLAKKKPSVWQSPNHKKIGVPVWKRRSEKELNN